MLRVNQLSKFGLRQFLIDLTSVEDQFGEIYVLGWIERIHLTDALRHVDTRPADAPTFFNSFIL